MKHRLLLLITLLSLQYTSLHAQFSASNPTNEQVKMMQDMNLSTVMLIAQAPGNFESLKGTVLEAKDGHTFYNLPAPSAGMSMGTEMICVEGGKTKYCAVFFGATGRDLAYAAFFMMPHFGNADGSFTITEEPSKYSSVHTYDLLLKGSKVATFEYESDIAIGTLTIGML